MTFNPYHNFIFQENWCTEKSIHLPLKGTQRVPASCVPNNCLGLCCFQLNVLENSIILLVDSCSLRLKSDAFFPPSTPTSSFPGGGLSPLVFTLKTLSFAVFWYLFLSILKGDRLLLKSWLGFVGVLIQGVWFLHSRNQNVLVHPRHQLVTIRMSNGLRELHSQQTARTTFGGGVVQGTDK